jgi:uncharacterized oxidoreductase
MKITGNTILITGGGSGIGLALAEAFVGAGNEVIICGRRESKLQEAQEAMPDIHVKRCDLSVAEERAALFEWTSSYFPQVNVLVNNAGIQRTIDFTKGTEQLFAGENEVETNLVAPIQLSAYFIPVLLEKEESAIVNVSSGLGFVPIAAMPVYCATKAAVHSFSASIRHQLRNTPIKVFEVIPPTVDTELNQEGRAARGQPHMGMPPAPVAQATLDGMENDLFEITVGESGGLASAWNFTEMFQNMNRW